MHNPVGRMDRPSERRSMSRLKEFRESKGYSQSQLGEMCGISVRTIQEYEQGRRKLDDASAERVYTIAKSLSVSMEKLLGYEEIRSE